MEIYAHRMQKLNLFILTCKITKPIKILMKKKLFIIFNPTKIDLIPIKLQY